MKVNTSLSSLGQYIRLYWTGADILSRRQGLKMQSVTSSVVVNHTGGPVSDRDNQLLILGIGSLSIWALIDHWQDQTRPIRLLKHRLAGVSRLTATREEAAKRSETVTSY